MHFLNRHLFFGCGNSPGIAERIGEVPYTLAIELIRDWAKRLQPRSNRSRCKGVDVWDLQIQLYRRLAESLSAESSAFRPFLGKVNDRIAERNFCVGDFALNLEAHSFLCAKSLPIEVDCCGDILERHPRYRDCVDCC